MAQCEWKDCNDDQLPSFYLCAQHRDAYLEAQAVTPATEPKPLSLAESAATFVGVFERWATVTGVLMLDPEHAEIEDAIGGTSTGPGRIVRHDDPLHRIADAINRLGQGVHRVASALEPPVVPDELPEEAKAK